jgi:hypothetical protein
MGYVTARAQRAVATQYADRNDFDAIALVPPLPAPKRSTTTGDPPLPLRHC